jgi:hypothetical protein
VIAWAFVVPCAREAGDGKVTQTAMMAQFNARIFREITLIPCRPERRRQFRARDGS